MSKAENFRIIRGEKALCYLQIKKKSGLDIIHDSKVPSSVVICNEKYDILKSVPNPGGLFPLPNSQQLASGSATGT